MSRIFIIALAAFCAQSSVLNAEIIRQPVTLEPGEEYRLMFVTTAERDARSDDIDDYNRFVQSVADNAPVVGTWGLEWKALASTSTVSARDNIGYREDSPTPVFRVDGTEITRFESNALHPRDIFNSSVGPVSLSELGTTRPRDLVWTGTGSRGKHGALLALLMNLLGQPLAELNKLASVHSTQLSKAKVRCSPSLRFLKFW